MRPSLIPCFAEREGVERESEEVIAPSFGSIHIELPGEVRISVEAQADPAMVRAVLASLRS
jgi:hypothetical protein